MADIHILYDNRGEGVKHKRKVTKWWKSRGAWGKYRVKVFVEQGCNILVRTYRGIVQIHIKGDVK